MKLKKGFSLIELLVSIAILSILAVVFVPKLWTYYQSTKQDKDAITIESVNTILKTALGEEAVQREVISYVQDGTFTITFDCDDAGKIIWENGTLEGKNTVALKNTKIWSVISADLESVYTCESKEHFNHSIRFVLTPKTTTTTADSAYSWIE